LRRAVRKHDVEGATYAEQLDDAIRRGIVGAAERENLLHYEYLRRECLYTDVFDRNLQELQGRA